MMLMGINTILKVMEGYVLFV